MLSGFDAVERDARELLDGLCEEDGTRRPDPQAWSVAECLDHLAISNRAYLDAIRAAASVPARDSREPGAYPGWLGRWIAWTLEPPVRILRTKAPALSRPRNSPTLHDASQAFLRSHHETVAFLRASSGVDLTRARFANPFIPGLKLSLAAGLHIIAAHERRHLWQAWRVRTRTGLITMSQRAGLSRLTDMHDFIRTTPEAEESAK